MISAKIAADSVNEFGNRITTMVITFPRIILAEFNTHRMFSRNSASSRAIPFEKMVKSVEENPFIPIAWQKDHKGMQGTEYLSEPESEWAKEVWLLTRDQAITNVQVLNAQINWKPPVTKQLCNRLLEPFMWHTVIITATEFENFFSLRCPQYDIKVDEIGGHSKYHLFRSKKEALEHRYQDVWLPNEDNIIEWLKLNKGQAEIHMMALAEAMWDTYNESAPKQLKAGEWHIPFGDNLNDDSLIKALEFDIPEIKPTSIISFRDPLNKPIVDKLKIKIATARCARVSYTVVGEEDKKDNYENDIQLHDRLLASGHMSPFEHCAKVMDREERYHNVRGEIEINNWDGSIDNKEEVCGWSGNFRGFIQYRKTIPGECK